MKAKTREEKKKLLLALSALNASIASLVESSGGTMEKEIILEEGTASSPAALSTATDQPGEVDSEIAGHPATTELEKCSKCGGAMCKASVGDGVSCPNCDQHGEAADLGKDLEDKSMTAQVSDQKTGLPDLTDDLTNASTEAAVVEPVVAETAEAALVTDTITVIQEKRTDDYEAGVHETQRMVQETTVFTDTEVVAEEAKETPAEEDVEEKTEAELSDQVSGASAPETNSLFTEKFTTEAIASLGLSETETAFVVGSSFIDLVKVIASLTQEVALHREQAKTAEFARVTEARVDELTALGVKLELGEGSSDRERIASMDEASFASYRDGVRDVQKSVASIKPEVVVKGKTVEQARANLRDLAVPAKLVEQSRKSKFAQI